MLSTAHQQLIVNAAQRYNASAVYLFGSSLLDEAKAHDMDLGVLGVPPAFFFDSYAELVKALPKSVDLIDLSKPTLFNRLVLRDGKKLWLTSEKKSLRNKKT